MSANPDIVYVLRDGENEELRYSLRTLVNLPHNRVFFYGGKPNWLKTNNYVPVKQTGSKWQNTSTLYKEIVDNENISEDFILMNDDFFILNPVEKLEYFYEGNLTDRAKRTILTDVWGKKRQSNYGSFLAEADTFLKAKGYGNNNYELHIPMSLNRNKLKQILEMASGIAWSARRSLYGNIWQVGGTCVKRDCKLYPRDTLPQDIEKWNFVSTTDVSFRQGRIGSYIKSKFKEKSIYEA